MFVESPGSLTFEVQDIPAISQIAHRHDAIVMMDNTWATPLHFRSFEHGVDVSIHAATKYISGHSDVMMGAILTTEALYPKINHLYRQLGMTVSGDDAYLALRGLRTLSVRLERHQRNAHAVTEWLAKQPEVAEILYPARPGSPGHALWRRDFTGACGLFGVVLHPQSDESIRSMLDGMTCFGMGYSWGGFESLILRSSPSSYRTATTWPWKGPTAADSRGPRKSRRHDCRPRGRIREAARRHPDTNESLNGRDTARAPWNVRIDSSVCDTACGRIASPMTAIFHIHLQRDNHERQTVHSSSGLLQGG